MWTNKDMGEAAELLLRASNNPSRSLVDFPEAFRPKNLAHAYGIQQAVSQELDAIGGWLIWQSHVMGDLLGGPVPLASIRPSPMRLASALDEPPAHAQYMSSDWRILAGL